MKRQLMLLFIILLMSFNCNGMEQLDEDQFSSSSLVSLRSIKFPTVFKKKSEDINGDCSSLLSRSKSMPSLKSLNLSLEGDSLQSSRKTYNSLKINKFSAGSLGMLSPNHTPPQSMECSKGTEGKTVNSLSSCMVSTSSLRFRNFSSASAPLPSYIAELDENKADEESECQEESAALNSKDQDIKICNVCAMSVEDQVVKTQSVCATFVAKPDDASDNMKDKKTDLQEKLDEQSESEIAQILLTTKQEELEESDRHTVDISEFDTSAPEEHSDDSDSHSLLDIRDIPKLPTQFSVPAFNLFDLSDEQRKQTSDKELKDTLQISDYLEKIEVPLLKIPPESTSPIPSLSTKSLEEEGAEEHAELPVQAGLELLRQYEEQLRRDREEHERIRQEEQLRRKQEVILQIKRKKECERWKQKREFRDYINRQKELAKGLEADNISEIVSCHPPVGGSLSEISLEHKKNRTCRKYVTSSHFDPRYVVSDPSYKSGNLMASVEKDKTLLPRQPSFPSALLSQQNDYLDSDEETESFQEYPSQIIDSISTVSQRYSDNKKGVIRRKKKKNRNQISSNEEETRDVSQCDSGLGQVSDETKIPDTMFSGDPWFRDDFEDFCMPGVMKEEKSEEKKEEDWFQAFCANLKGS